MNRVDKDPVTGIITRAKYSRIFRDKRLRELMEAARGEGEFCMDEDRGGFEAAMGEWKLRIKSELEAELGLTAAAFGDDFGDGVAGDAAGEAPIEDGTAQGAFFSGRWPLKKACWVHRIERERE